MDQPTSDNDIQDSRIRQFALDCRAAGSTPEEVLQSAGLHRSTWFRWKGGKFAPTMKTWDRAQAALSSLRRANSSSQSNGAAA